MGRPRKWADDAERKRAERGASSAPAENLPKTPGWPVPAEPIVVPEEATEVLVRSRKIPSEKNYVDHEVAQTSLAIERGLHDHDGQRVERARRYARSRYRSFVSGEVSSL